MARYINAHEYKERISRYPKNIRDIAIKELRYTKTADVRENVRGEWKIKKASIHPYGNDVCCSICGHTMGSSFGYKFCPMCGADMRGDNHDK